MKNVVFVLLFVCSCGELQQPDIQPDIGRASDGGSEPDTEEDTAGLSGGSLPPGFYQRQCQWDACNPPPEAPGALWGSPGDGR